MIARGRILAVLTVLTLCATLPACLFSTREDEVQPPVQGGNTVSLNDPLQVFVAINEALRVKQDANYERALSESFLFSPTLQDSLDQNFIGTGVFTDWNKQREMDALGLLLSTSLFIHADFVPSIEINKNTFVRFLVDYDLQVVSTSAPADTTHYRGVTFIDVRLESGNWRITFGWNEGDAVDVDLEDYH